MPESSKRIALVTGASSGIGAAGARRRHVRIDESQLAPAVLAVGHAGALHRARQRVRGRLEHLRGAVASILGVQQQQQRHRSAQRRRHRWLVAVLWFVMSVACSAARMH